MAARGPMSGSTSASRRSLLESCVPAQPIGKSFRSRHRCHQPHTAGLIADSEQGRPVASTWAVQNAQGVPGEPRPARMAPSRRRGIYCVLDGGLRSGISTDLATCRSE
jgi:hypothetical protein